MDMAVTRGRCSGWRPSVRAKGVFGYTNDDIFYLEVCLFHQMCENGAELFRLPSTSRPFLCDFSPRRFAELGAILTSAPPSPDRQRRDCRPRTDPSHE